MAHRTSWAAARFQPGHPEGYILAFANLYTETAFAIGALKAEKSPEPWLKNLPGIDDGVIGIRMIEAATRSHRAGSSWVAL